MAKLKNTQDVQNLQINKQRLHSANHEEIKNGHTSDIYFVRSNELLAYAGLDKSHTHAEIFASREGVFAGIEEVCNLLKDSSVSVWALEEGTKMNAKEVVMQLSGPYSEFGLYETPMLGMLASASGWATAAKACIEAAEGSPVYCFGARHVHPAVAPVMERAAIIGGAENCSCIIGSKLMGKEPVGTVPHAAMLVIGDTLKTALLYDESMPEDSPRIILVDTFKDEAEETLRVAEALKKKLNGVRLDTPGERGGVTTGLVKEIRARLDQAGYDHVQIFVSGGVNPERIQELKEAGADAFGVGSYIAGNRPIDMTMDLKEIEGNPIAKRGRIPGLTKTSRLVKYL